MKIVMISDIHGNFDALNALSESYDELWVLGDLVNYGPQPREVVDFVRQHAIRRRPSMFGPVPRNGRDDTAFFFGSAFI